MFVQITSANLYNNEIKLFKSNRSKLTVAITNCRGPIIRANFHFVTEASDDSGIPHMLEHCIFYGCRLHNGKGILDIASNLNYVVDTNASTTQDSTSYYFDCANFTGFINAFKLFFEHLMSPMLEINNYKTEVHSIDGEGLDIGVLYSEISGVERNFKRIVNNRTKKMLYGNSSVYSYNIQVAF
uniref:Peptidase M16 N-terminal domain-containing protein n=1 Tax=Meloidogyne incognita TaxID=6306 RepID=A0A914MCM6_MELIC